MRTAIFLLAIAGFIAVGLRVVRALIVALYRGAGAFLTRDAADVRARRGDLTGLAEAKDAYAAARRRKLHAVGHLLLWGGLLVVPPLTPWPSMLYASYSLLWLLPRRPVTMHGA